MTNQEKKDLAQSYRTMIDLAAWKHFEKNILDVIEQRAVSDFSTFAITPNTLCDLAALRGQMLTIRKIKNDLSYILSET